MELVITAIASAGLGLIPASIAKKKGYDFVKWWLYGWLLFLIALVHVCLIPDKTTQAPQPSNLSSPADELKKYKELLDEGVITEAEFLSKKEQLLKLI